MERQATNIKSNVKMKIGAWQLEGLIRKDFEDFGIKEKNDRNKAVGWQTTGQTMWLSNYFWFSLDGMIFIV